MKHKKYEELIILSIYNELDKKEEMELIDHLNSCLDCKVEYEKYKSVQKTLSTQKIPAMEDEVLNDLRRELSMNIIGLKKKKVPENNPFNLFSFIFGSKFKLSMGFSFIFLIGIFIGNLITPKSNGIIDRSMISIKNIDELSTVKNDKIKNIRFNANDISNGEIEIYFDEVVDKKISGNINDKGIQKLLALSLLNDQNPGTRFKTVSFISSEKSNGTDNDLKEALLKAAKFDNNPGVRKEALRVLKKLPFDKDIKEVYLYVLNNDQNSALRIAAINNLGEVKDIEMSADINYMNTIKSKIKSDENDYVRLKAKTILNEIKQ